MMRSSDGYNHQSETGFLVWGGLSIFAFAGKSNRGWHMLCCSAVGMRMKNDEAAVGDHRRIPSVCMFFALLLIFLHSSSMTDCLAAFLQTSSAIIFEKIVNSRNITISSNSSTTYRQLLWQAFRSRLTQTSKITAQTKQLRWVSFETVLSSLVARPACLIRISRRSLVVAQLPTSTERNSQRGKSGFVERCYDWIWFMGIVNMNRFSENPLHWKRWGTRIVSTSLRSSAIDDMQEYLRTSYPTLSIQLSWGWFKEWSPGRFAAPWRVNRVNPTDFSVHTSSIPEWRRHVTNRCRLVQ